MDRRYELYCGGDLQFSIHSFVDTLKELSYWRHNIQDCNWLHSTPTIRDTVRAKESGALLLGTRPRTEYVKGQPRPPRGITLIWKPIAQQESTT